VGPDACDHPGVAEIRGCPTAGGRPAGPPLHRRHITVCAALRYPRQVWGVAVPVGGLLKGIANAQDNIFLKRLPIYHQPNR
jgi:hypothetical protein